MKKVKEEGIVKFPEKLGFGAFSMSNNIVFNFKGLYYLTFLKMVLGAWCLVLGAWCLVPGAKGK